MYSFLKSKIRGYIRGIVDQAITAQVDTDLFSISRARQRIALESSAKLVNRVMASAARLPGRNELLRFALEKVEVSGLYLEFGVATGATINLIAPLVPERIYGFDTFEGLPEAWGGYMPRGSFKQAVIPTVDSKVELVVGLFSNTLPDFLSGHPEQVAFLHIDCDLYSSTKSVFGALADRIVPNSIIVFDEYFNYPEWEEGEYKAFCEFLAERGLSCSYIGYSDSQQVAVRIEATVEDRK